MTKFILHETVDIDCVINIMIGNIRWHIRHWLCYQYPYM